MNKSTQHGRLPGDTEFGKFDNFFRAVIAVPKAVIDKEDAKWKRSRAKKLNEETHLA